MKVTSALGGLTASVILAVVYNSYTGKHGEKYLNPFKTVELRVSQTASVLLAMVYNS